MKKIDIDAMGLACPGPVLEAKKAMKNTPDADCIEVSIDNDIAVQNLQKLANKEGWQFESDKISDSEFKARFLKDEKAAAAAAAAKEAEASSGASGESGDYIISIGSRYMGSGNDELGEKLMNSLIFSLTQVDKAPKAVVFFNEGVYLTTHESKQVEDLKVLAENGTQIISCGTCLGFFELEDKLLVGEVSNMYEIVEVLSSARVIRI